METNKVMRKCLALILFFIPSLFASTTEGSVQFGYWFVKNNLLSLPNALENDGVGDVYLEKNYSLFQMGLKLKTQDLFSSTPSNFYFDAKSFLNPSEKSYSLGISNKNRTEIRELSFEFKDLISDIDVWAGRQTVFELGGARVDGGRFIYTLSPHYDVAAFLGLGQDPRNQIGFIGSDYKNNIVSKDFLTLGAYTSGRHENFRFDLGFVSDFFKGSVDRLYTYAQGNYFLSRTFVLSSLVEWSVVPQQLNQIQLSLLSRLTNRLTNTISFYRFSPRQYNKSNVSDIPYPFVSPAEYAFISKLNTSSYNLFREHLKFLINDKDYVFASFDFTRRTYDNKNRLKYSLGYHDLSLWGSSFDFRFQTDLINNYESFHTAFDFLLGKEFADGSFRMETGLTLFSQERDVFVFNAQTASISEKEYTLRLNGIYYARKGTAFYAGYTFSQETESLNDSDNVKIHEFYLTTNFTF